MLLKSSVPPSRATLPCWPTVCCVRCVPLFLQVLGSLPKGTHPMTQFAQAILALQVGRLCCVPCAGRWIEAGLANGGSWRDACSAKHTLQKLSLVAASACLLDLQIDSMFAEAYNSGVHKSK